MKFIPKTEADFFKVEENIGASYAYELEKLEEAKQIKRELLPLLEEFATEKQMELLTGLTAATEWLQSARDAWLEKNPVKKNELIHVFLRKFENIHPVFTLKPLKVSSDKAEYELVYFSNRTSAGYLTSSSEFFFGTVREAYARADKLSKRYKTPVSIFTAGGEPVGGSDEGCVYF